MEARFRRRLFVSAAAAAGSYSKIPLQTSCRSGRAWWNGASETAARILPGQHDL